MPLNIWLKVDTGMGRLGFFNPQEALDAYQILLNHPQVIKPIGIMSHFVCADDISHPLNQRQIESFDSFVTTFLV